MARVLYISYDGMFEPLGQSQVLSYLKKLAKANTIHLISFEKAMDSAVEADRVRLEREISASGIQWHPLRYHKRPSALATAWDIGCGTAVGVWLILRHRLDTVHARSYVSSAMALVLKRMLRVRYVFDMRGFWADERVDGGIWPPGGRMYRIAKWFERQFLLAADHVISLTNAGVEEIRRFPYLQARMPRFTVIPTCADLTRFVPAERARDRKAFVLGYVGSAGTWYLFDEAVACFAELLKVRPDARLHIVNRGEHAFIRQRLAVGGVPPTAFELTTATHAEIPLLMAEMDAGMFFIRPVFSKQASAPTKLAEFLGCGIPCLGNAGVGDMARILEGDRVGIALDRFDRGSMREGLMRLMEMVADPACSRRCVAAAERHFSLERGVQMYEAVYDSLGGDPA